MLFFLIELFRSFNFKVPAVFEYSSTRLALASLTSLLVTIFFGKHFIKKLYEWKIGDVAKRQHCEILDNLHQNKNDTPTMGGILILFSLLVSLFLWMDLKSLFTLILFVTTLTFGFIGALDDYLKLKKKNTKGLSAKQKLLIQVFFSVLIALYFLWPSFDNLIQMGSWFKPPYAKDPASFALLSAKEYGTRLYLPFLKNPLFVFSGFTLFLMVIFITFVITGASNAVNLTDGLDGLATGTVCLCAFAFSIIAFISNNQDLSRTLHILYIEGASEIAIYLAAVAGACLGFLWYNGAPAQVFMGDTGSLSLGAILGVSAVLLKRELLFVIIGGIFVLEALSVVLQVGSYKLRNKKRIFLCAPLHHHFEYKGVPETKVVLRFWIIGLLLAIVGIASLKFQ